MNSYLLESCRDLICFNLLNRTNQAKTKTKTKNKQQQQQQQNSFKQFSPVTGGCSTHWELQAWLASYLVSVAGAREDQGGHLGRTHVHENGP